MVLIFFRDPLGPVQCAVEVARALGGGGVVPVRTGIHSGPVARETDINGQEDVTGSGINLAQRVMDCGDAGHILLSEASASVVREFAAWAPYLQEIGEATVKHGARLRLFSLVTEGAGNPALPSRLGPDPRLGAAGDTPPPPVPSPAAWPTRGRYLVPGLAAAAVLAAVAAPLALRQRPDGDRPAATPTAAKNTSATGATADALLASGLASLRTGATADALRDLDDCLTQDPEMFQARYARAVCYLRAGDASRAAADYATAYHQEGTGSSLFSRYMDVPTLPERFSSAADRLAAADREASAAGASPDALVRRAAAYLSLGNYDAAGFDVNAARLPNAGDAEAARVTALVAIRASDWKAAADAAGRALPTTGSGKADPDLYLLRGYARLKAGDASAALPDLERFVASQPEAAAGYYYRGECRFAREEYALAAADHGEAIRRAPREGAPYLARGRCRLQTGDLDGAAADLDRAATLVPKQPRVYYYRGWVNDSRAKRATDGAERTRLRQAAIRDYETYLRLYPDASDAGKVQQWIKALQ